MTENTFRERDFLESKAKARQRLLAVRERMDAEQRGAADAAISQHVSATIAHRYDDTFGVYWPIRNEPNLHGLYLQLANQGIRLALPVIVNRTGPLLFADWTPGEKLDIDRWGICTPTQKRMVTPTALLVPCVGVDQAGFRLGYGGGFYDRTLASIPRPMTIGIAYAETVTPFPHDEHDVPMDIVITQNQAGRIDHNR